LRSAALQIIRHRVGVGHVKRTGRRFVPEARLEKDLLDFSVFDAHRKAPTAHAEAGTALIEQPVHIAGEVSVPLLKFRYERLL
jgi:hypothetical protein